MEKCITTHSPEETVEAGVTLAKEFSTKEIICFSGDLGVGKTTLIKGIITALTSFSREEINSPTFTYLHTYEGEKKVHHFDLYRMESFADFLAKGLDEYFDDSAICCIEWAEKITPILPKNCYRVDLHYHSPTKRVIKWAPST